MGILSCAVASIRGSAGHSQVVVSVECDGDCAAIERCANTGGGMWRTEGETWTLLPASARQPCLRECGEIIEALGGSMHLESSVGHGSACRLRLPRVQCSHASCRVSTVAHAAASRNETQRSPTFSGLCPSPEPQGTPARQGQGFGEVEIARRARCPRFGRRSVSNSAVSLIFRDVQELKDPLIARHLFSRAREFHCGAASSNVGDGRIDLDRAV